MNPPKILRLGCLLALGIPFAARNINAADSANPAANSAITLEITKTGAIADGKTVNTKSIQAAIDQLATQGGGTVVVTSGTFVSGALFFKPGVNLRLDKDAVLQCSTDMANFPPQRTRIEGHFEPSFTPAFINAYNCDGFQLTGRGTLDGAGRPIWDAFWAARNANKNFKNVELPRARLCLIQNSKNVTVDGVTFKDSQFWNLHLYHDSGVTVQNTRFQVPDDYRQAPSTDGIDVDSSQNVTIRGCYFSVTDDCIALKGSKGPQALDDKDSPPVEHIRIENCTFKRGGGVFTLGSEATIIRDVIAENCTVTGRMAIATIKLRPDTPQTYDDIHYNNITLSNSDGVLINLAPWKQYFDLKGAQLPQSTVHNITISNINGATGSIGHMAGNPGQTTINGITFENINVTLKNAAFSPAKDITNLTFKNVTVNGQPFTGPTTAQPSPPLSGTSQ